MSIAPDSSSRGCASKYHQPLGETEELEAQYLTATIHFSNCRLQDPPLDDIIYRNSVRDEDISRHVFRWDRTHYQDVFRDGFQARRQQGTPNDIYHFYNLDRYIKSGGPLGDSEPANCGFISTTVNSGWYPSVELEANQTQTVVDAWRYEIYAPGGIWIAETLGHHDKYPSQDICFVAGIAPQYNRSAQRFRLIVDRASRYTRRERADNALILNANFNPQSHPQRLINIQRPLTYYIDENGRREEFCLSYYHPDQAANNNIRRVQGTSTPSDSIKAWYKNGASNLEFSTIDAAFRSCYNNEVYLFMKNEYVLLNYAPGSTNDKVLNGPLLICEGYPSLKGTPFAEYGIDCAFRCHDKYEAFIFCGNICARINYAPRSTRDYIIDGPKMVTRMFPFFKKTVFENGVDAAFESTTSYEAYLFRGDQYALINYGSSGKSPRLIAIRSISQGFGGLRNTIFETGFDASFASHHKNEAYLFKGDSYALINFAPGSTNDYIIGGVKKVRSSWPSLQPVFPRKNWGVDLYS